MKHILLIFALLALLSSCRTTKKAVSESHTASTIVSHDTVYSTSYRDRIVTDTLRDSVYIREVVTTEGKTIYVEKNTSRDHKAQTITKHDTVFVRVNDKATSDASETKVEETKTTSHTPFVPFLIILAFAAGCCALVGLLTRIVKV